MKISRILLIALPVLFSGCIQQIAVSTVGNIVHDGFSGFMEETDLEFAEQALPGNLKLLEVMLKNDPENRQILRLLAEGYSSYALGFVEDKDPARARLFYVRASDYGRQILRQDSRIARALDGPASSLGEALAGLDADMVPDLFWTAFGLGSYITLNLSDPDALADLPRAEAMMDFVARSDSGFYYAGAHLFLGTLYGSRPKILGGDIEKAKRHFEAALRINGGRFLMTQVYYARSVAVQTLDEDLFEKLLSQVETASLDVLPEARLANAIAKRKAELLKARKDELF
jgi:hypothetical protein